MGAAERRQRRTHPPHVGRPGLAVRRHRWSRSVSARRVLRIRPCRRPLTGARTTRRDGVVRKDGRRRGSASPAFVQEPTSSPPSRRRGHQPWDENFRRQALRATSPHHRSRGLPGSSRPWSDGLKLTLTGASQDLARPVASGSGVVRQLWRVQAISRRRPSSAASRSTRLRLRSAHRPDTRSSPRLRTARCSGSGPTLAHTDIPRRT